MAERIDAHQHFWHYAREDYGWIGETMSSLQRDFLPDDLSVELRAQGFAGSVAVQARQTVEETLWLLSLAHADERIAGVVGWMPLCSEALRDALDQLPNYAMLKGLRHVLQDEPSDELMLGEAFQRGLRVLTERGLAYDLLIYERQLSSARALVDRHPDQVFVLDHIGKPRIAEGAMEPWSAQVREMARRPNVFCKVSGMVTEADWKAWSPEMLRPYFDGVLEAFGPERMMFGSDWPVCTVATSYAQWCGTVEAWTSGLSQDERDAIFGETARRVYRLSETRRRGDRL